MERRKAQRCCLALRMALRGPWPRSAHRLAALHQRRGPAPTLRPQRADMHRAANHPMPSAAAFSLRPRIRAGLERDAQIGDKARRRIVGALAPRPPFRPTPQAASPRSGSGRVNLSLPGGRVRHEPRGRRASLRSQERLRTAPLTNEAVGI